MTYTIGTAFSGIGVPDLAGELLGCRTLWQIEIDEYCQRVLEKNFPDAVRYRDIHDVSGLPYVDIFIAGFPCQPFSIAGSRKGSADERYLIPEMMRVINEVRPRICILENVPHFAALNDGAEFRTLLRSLAESGYDAQWMHLSARDFGGMHERERLWIVGYTECYGHSQSSAVVNASRKPERHAATYQQSARAKSAASFAAGQILVNTSGKRREKQHAPVRRSHLGQSAWRPFARQSHRIHQSRLGRNAHGAARRLDFRPDPAPANAPQYPHEPPRATAQDTPNRAKRIKALGNGMYFWTVYHVLDAVLAWLQAQGVESATA